MKLNKLSTCCAAVISLAACGGAIAEESRWYATANAGFGVLGEQDLEYRADGVNGTDSVDFDASFAGGGTIGYQFNNQWRGEAEIMYRRNEQSDPINLTGLGSFSDGDFASLTFALSALYDFNLFSNPDVKGYVGGGVAFIQEIDIDFEEAGQEISFETDDVALQLQFGARYKLSDRWFADASVRYLVASDIEMERPEDTAQTLTSDYSPLTVSVGVGFRF